MDNKEKSIEYQLRAGTKERNERIREQYQTLVEMGIKGVLSIIGRKQKPQMSRQRVFQIIHKET